MCQSHLFAIISSLDLHLHRLRGPAGIYIDRNTPAKIAVSNLAEILAVKNGV